ncbi:hypothetical protein [Streptomyces sp. NPDC047061]|uniref:hypothetical protein n=1 Tax=Streptomyces sp. NPDC047061 TaxID=3154605 RepID=UPI0033CC2F40
MSKPRTRVRVGVDVGKGHHWAAVVDETGVTLWSTPLQETPTWSAAHSPYGWKCPDVPGYAALLPAVREQRPR